MKQHKWHKEIKAWADGAEIEYRSKDALAGWSEWKLNDNGRFLEDSWWEFRIKPQPKEPQYLYVYQDRNDLQLFITNGDVSSKATEIYLGKIKLENE